MLPGCLMPTQTIYALGESQITISGGGQLDGVNQGDGSHLEGLTITLNSNAWETIDISDNDTDFDDNDGNQEIDGAQTFDGVNYSDGTGVEAEYTLVLEDPDGNQYTVYGFNLHEPGQSPAFGTVEGLAFLADGVGPTEFPPIGVPLTVVDAFEGPKDNPYTALATPPCFTPGTLILTDRGPVDVAELKEGDFVWTLDNGFRPIRWIGRRVVTARQLDQQPRFRPIRIAQDAFGPRLPSRDMHVSPQHRVFVNGWRAQLYAGQDEVLATATKLCNGSTITRDDDVKSVTYIHLLFDQHEVIWSNGLLSESFFPAAAPHTAVAHELHALFPEKFSHMMEMETARPCVSDASAVVLVN